MKEQQPEFTNQQAAAAKLTGNRPPPQLAASQDGDVYLSFVKKYINLHTTCVLQCVHYIYVYNLVK